MSAQLFYAYRTRYSDHIYVKPGGIEDEIEALNSPSVFAVVRSIEARNFEEAESIAKEQFAAGHYQQTHAAAAQAQQKGTA